MDNDTSKTPVDPEPILYTLDQLTQTVDVMNKVIVRLRGYVQQNMAAQRQGELDFDNIPAGKPGASGLH
jgi:hypothetical protein